MKTLNGVECAKLLRDIGVNSLIVFITSSAEYVFSGYEVKAFRYILKTDLVNAFSRVFGECLTELKKLNTSFFTVKTSSSVKNIPLSDILYFESNKRVLIVHIKGEDHSFYGKLDDIEDSLKNDNFIRIHRSYIVNISFIDRIIRDFSSNLLVVLTDDTELPISQSYMAEVRAVLGF